MGFVVGSLVGSRVATSDGANVGVGEVVSSGIESVVGSTLGMSEGDADGMWVGTRVRIALGAKDGVTVGTNEGDSVGKNVGTFVANCVGVVGASVGNKEGTEVGTNVGTSDKYSASEKSGDPETQQRFAVNAPAQQLCFELADVPVSQHFMHGWLMSKHALSFAYRQLTGSFIGLVKPLGGWRRRWPHNPQALRQYTFM